MVAADRERIPITSKDEDVQVRPRQGNATRKRQRTPMDKMRTVRLHKVGKATGTANPGNGGDLFVPELPLFNELKIEGQNREIAAARAPCWVVGSEFLFRQSFAL